MSATTAGTTTARSPRMRRPVLITLLVISAILNLFFIVGAVWIRWHAPHGWPSLEQRYREMAGQLNLTPEQRPGFDKYVAAMRARTEKMHQQVGPLIGSAWEEIAKPQSDQTQVLKLFDEAADKRREFQREATVQTLDFLSILTPEQRGKFVALARQHVPPWLRPPRKP